MSEKVKDPFSEPKVCYIADSLLADTIDVINAWERILEHLKPQRYHIRKRSSSRRHGDKVYRYRYVEVVDESGKVVARSREDYYDDVDALVTIVRSEELMLGILETIKKLKEDVKELVKIQEWLCQ